MKPRAASVALRHARFAVGLLLAALGCGLLVAVWLDRVAAPAASIWNQTQYPGWGVSGLHVSSKALVLASAALLAVGWVLCRRLSFVTRLTQNKHFPLAVASIALVGLWLPVALVGQSAVLGGERYWWLQDDAMISMRYAANFAHGHGLVWNPGEPVEGYSNFLWTLYMSLVHLLPLPPSRTSLAVLLTNIALAVAIIPATAQLARSLGGTTFCVAGALAAYVLSKDSLVWTAGGFETTLLTALFVVTVARAVRESGREPTLLTYLLIASLSLIRADAIVLSALLYAACLLLSGKRKAAAGYCLISLLVPAAHELFRISYYGDILPNTAYLKATRWAGRYAAGVAYVAAFLKQYGWLALLAALSSLVSRDRARLALLGCCVLYTSYVAYVGGDAFPNHRFLVPMLPLLFCLAFFGVQRLPRIVREAIVVLCVATMPVLVSGYSGMLRPQPHGPGNVKIGLLLKENTLPTSKVADFWAGSVFYFSERYGVDLLGKSDRHIARLAAVSDGTKPGHNKFDFDYSLGQLRPDVVVPTLKLPVDEEVMRQRASGDWAFSGRIYFHPVFRQHYLPNPVEVDTWRTIFVSDQSPEINRMDSWRRLGR